MSLESWNLKPGNSIKRKTDHFKQYYTKGCSYVIHERPTDLRLYIRTNQNDQVFIRDLDPNGWEILNTRAPAKISSNIKTNKIQEFLDEVNNINELLKECTVTFQYNQQAFILDGLSIGFHKNTGSYIDPQEVSDLKVFTKNDMTKLEIKKLEQKIAELKNTLEPEDEEESIASKLDDLSDLL